MKLSKILLISLLVVVAQACNSKTNSNKESSENLAGFAGTGCSSSSIKVTTDPITKTISLDTLLPSYEAGKDTSGGLKRTACSFAIPIKISKGFKISNIEADWKGYIKGKGKFGRKYFLAGTPDTSWIRDNYDEPSGNSFHQQDNISSTNLETNVDCLGGRYNLRINTQIRVEGSKSYISLAKKHKLKISLHFKSCEVTHNK